MLDDYSNAENSFIQDLHEMIHDRVMLFYHSKTSYPIDEDLLRASAFYAKVVFAIALDQPIRRAQFQDMGFLETDDVVTDTARELYMEWRKEGLNGAIEAYCSCLSRLLETSAGKISDQPYFYLPDFLCQKEEIRALLIRARGKKKDLKNLALKY